MRGKKIPSRSIDPKNRMCMQKLFTTLVLAFFILVGFTACDKKESLHSAAVEDYFNFAVGKYVRYRLDSTLYINFGQKDTVIKYQARDVIEAAVTDNLGRASWRVVRYLSDSSGTKPWTPATTYLITPTRETIEWVENNLRFQKLKLPITEGFNWKGNSFIDTYSINSEVRFMDDWDYTYEDVDAPFTVLNNQIIQNTTTVNQRDEIIGFPNDPNLFSEKTYSKEVYGQGIGMIYRDFIHWEYQPPNGGNPGYKSGYGIKMVMIDHN